MLILNIKDFLINRIEANYLSVNIFRVLFKEIFSFLSFFKKFFFILNKKKNSNFLPIFCLSDFLSFRSDWEKNKNYFFKIKNCFDKKRIARFYLKNENFLTVQKLKKKIFHKNLFKFFSSLQLSSLQDLSFNLVSLNDFSIFKPKNFRKNKIVLKIKKKHIPFFISGIDIKKIVFFGIFKKEIFGKNLHKVKLDVDYLESYLNFLSIQVFRTLKLNNNTSFFVSEIFEIFSKPNSEKNLKKFLETKKRDIFFKSYFIKTKTFLYKKFVNPQNISKFNLSESLCIHKNRGRNLIKIVFLLKEYCYNKNRICIEKFGSKNSFNLDFSNFFRLKYFLNAKFLNFIEIALYRVLLTSFSHFFLEFKKKFAKKTLDHIYSWKKKALLEKISPLKKSIKNLFETILLLLSLFFIFKNFFDKNLEKNDFKKRGNLNPFSEHFGKNENLKDKNFLFFLKKEFDAKVFSFLLLISSFRKKKLIFSIFDPAFILSEKYRA